VTHTQTAELDPDVLVYGLEMPLDPQVSPDGERVLYRLVHADRDADAARSRLVVRSWRGDDQLELTGAGALDAWGRWSPDGGRIAFVSDRAPKNGIFVVDAAGGEPRELARHDWPIAGLAWSPDGTRLAYTVRVGGTAGREPVVRVTRRPDYKLDGVGFIGDARSQVHLLDVGSAEVRRLTADSNDLTLPRWSPDGRTLAALRSSLGLSGPTRLALISADTGDTTLVGPEGGPIHVWSWSPAGDRIVFAADPGRTYQPDFYSCDVATGETVRLTDDPAVSVTSSPLPASMPVWLDDRRLAFSGARHGTCGLYELDVVSGAIRLLRGWDAINGSFSSGRAAGRFAFAQTSLAHPSEIVTLDLESGHASPLTRHSAAVLASHPVAIPERMEVARGGETIEAWLLKPADFDASRRYPVVLDIHGGPNSWYGCGFVSQQQCLASHGFLVVFANPRGSATYGRRFAGLVFRDWGGEDYADLMAVVDAVLERPYADGDRLGILGYSYGGYMTSWTIGHTDRFRAAVCGAPCFDLTAHWGASDIGDAWDHVQWGGPPHERPEWFRDRSPSTFAHRVTTPTLIVQGEADDRCPVGQGHHMYTALHNAGCEVELALYPGASHQFISMPEGRPSQRHDYLTRTLAWFQQHL
jgi:dipeptidyl aminopeptidase/acylaminoacyl peptidase